MAAINGDIGIEGSITLPELNQIIRKLIQNDVELGGQSVHPTIWECTWYNSDKSQISNYGYDIGDAVWVNTENVDKFILAHENDIHDYAIGNSKTKYRVEQLSSDTDRDKLLNLYRDIVNGDNGYDRLYYLGDISSDVQIRVSLSANNTEPPSSDKYWTDFIRRDLTQEYYTALILSSLEVQLSDQMESHMQKYHLKNLLGSSGQHDTNSYLDGFLRNDMSNLETGHKMLNHKYSHDMDGLDYVVDEQYINYSNGCFKWYRKWYSGFLEQGGVIDTSKCSELGDEKMYGGEFYKVMLPISYDYPTQKVGSFYMRDSNIDAKNSKGRFGYVDDTDALEYTYRYSVTITRNPSLEHSIPYANHNSESDDQCYYETTDILHINNSSFTFNCYNGGVFSFETRGFSVS